MDYFETQLKRGRKENNKAEKSQRLSMHIPRHSVHSKLIKISRPWFTQFLLFGVQLHFWCMVEEPCAFMRLLKPLPFSDTLHHSGGLPEKPGAGRSRAEQTSLSWWKEFLATPGKLNLLPLFCIPWTFTLNCPSKQKMQYFPSAKITQTSTVSFCLVSSPCSCLDWQGMNDEIDLPGEGCPGRGFLGWFYWQIWYHSYPAPGKKRPVPPLTSTFPTCPGKDWHHSHPTLGQTQFLR